MSLFDHQILERHAVRIVLGEPAIAASASAKTFR
jgi:hypothetical protein